MSAIINGTMEGITYLFDDLGDPRVKDWWLMSTPGPVVMIIATYLYFCSYAGPEYMKNKKPFKLKNVLMLYNLFQIVMSIFLTYRGIEYVYKTNYCFVCQQVDYSDTPENVKWAASVWWYFFSKITELLDTVFFVLRKKNNQISFLHLYHHTMMPLLAWFGTKYTAGGQAIPEGSINAFIHILMYGYYFVAGLGPQFHKYLWWKKHLTTLQLIQFCIVLYLNVTGFFTPNCNYPKYLNVFVIFNCMAFLYMFGNFYYKSYINKNKSSTKEKKEN